MQDVQSVTVTLATATVVPNEVDVDEIAEDAAQAAGEVIATALDRALGGKTWGDVSPDELGAIGAFFQLWVRSYALNNSRVARLNEVGEDEIGIWAVCEDPKDPQHPLWVGHAFGSLNAFDQFADDQGFAPYSAQLDDPGIDSDGLVYEVDGVPAAIFTNTTVYAVQLDPN